MNIDINTYQNITNTLIKNKLEKILKYNQRLFDENKLNKTFLLYYKKNQLDTETTSSNLIENIKHDKYNKNEWKGLIESNNSTFFDIFNLSHQSIKDIHHTILKYHHPKIAGIYKIVENMVGGQETSPSIYTPNHIAIIIKEYEELFDKYDLKNNIVNSIIFILNFLIVHPFVDGNGRVSRVLLNRLLIKSGLKFIKYKSLSEYVSIKKSKYYETFRNTRNGVFDTYRLFNNTNAEDFVLFYLDIILKAFEDFNKQLDLLEYLTENDLSLWIVTTIKENNNLLDRREIYKRLNIVISKQKFNQVIKELVKNYTLFKNGYKLSVNI